MKKATFIGTVVAGTSQQEAIAAYLETINGGHDNSKVVCGVSESSGQVFLTSLSNIAKPLSPISGAQECLTVMSDKDKIAQKLQLMSDGEMVASGKFELKSSTCPTCSSHLVSDNADLLAHCIVCGTEQEDEEEGEESVDVSIMPDAEDETLSSDEDEMDVDSDLNILVEAMNEQGFEADAETLKEVIDNGTLSEDGEALKERIVELLGESVFEQAITDGNLEEVLIDAILEGEEDESEDDSDEGESDSSDDEDESEDDESEEDFDEDEGEGDDEDDESESSDDADEDDEDDIDEEVLASILASADDEEEEEESEDEGEDDESEACDTSKANAGKGEGNEADACDKQPAVTQDQNKGTIGAKVETDIEDTMEVDLLEDGIGASAALASNKVQLVYAPSDNVGETKWYAIANNAPVAVATMHSVGAEKAGMFTTDAFRKGTEMLMTQMGVAEGLMGMGFKSMKMRLPVKNIVASHVATATASVKTEADGRVNSIAEDVRAALATAAVGINKGFFSNLSNPIKAQLYEVLSAAGVKSAEVLIDNAFDAASDDYHRTLLMKAFDLMGKPVEARNEISQAVMTASYQRASGSEGASLSSSVGHRLSHIGASPAAGGATMTASAQATPSRQQSDALVNRIHSVVGGLGLSR